MRERNDYQAPEAVTLDGMNASVLCDSNVGGNIDDYTDNGSFEW